MQPRNKKPEIDLAEVVVITFIVITAAILVGSLLGRSIGLVFR